jgi:hypothetical protein
MPGERVGLHSWNGLAGGRLGLGDLLAAQLRPEGKKRLSSSLVCVEQEIENQAPPRSVSPCEERSEAMSRTPGKSPGFVIHSERSEQERAFVKKPLEGTPRISAQPKVGNSAARFTTEDGIPPQSSEPNATHPSAV